AADEHLNDEDQVQRIRNLVIGLIRQAGHTRIAATLRKIKNNPHLILTLLGLTPDPQNRP
ncbi:MAG: hypothetical protein M3R63_20405, partial [Actinomycetota bacterium]|nr:hypothetical protein [Actinomycetota bacterium]